MPQRVQSIPPGVGQDGGDRVQLEDLVGRNRTDLLRAGQHVCVGGSAGEGALHRGFFGVAGGETVVPVDPGDAEQKEVGGDRTSRFGRGDATGNRGVFVDPPSEQEDLDGRVVDERGRDRRAVGDHRCGQIGRKRASDREGGGAAVENRPVTGLDQLGGAGGDPSLALGSTVPRER